MIDRHIAGLSSFLTLDRPIVLREQTLSNAQGIGVLIAGLLVKKAGAKLDKSSADALTEDYLDAIEDLPAWSVREALRKWNRGESQRIDAKPHDFNWAPTPPTLKRLSEFELGAIKVRIMRLQKLTAAVALIEFSEEHCAEMRARIAALPAEAARIASERQPTREAAE